MAEEAENPEDMAATDANIGSAANKKKKSSGNGASFVDLSSRPAEFIIAPKASVGDVGLQMFADGGGALVAQLRNYSGLDIRVVRQLPAHGAEALSGGGSEALVVSMDERKGRQLRAQSLSPTQPIWVEANEKLTHFLGSFLPWGHEPQFLFGPGESVQFDVLVLGENDAPIAGAVVTAYGFGLPVSTRSDANGHAVIDVPQGGAGSIAALVIDPPSMHWSKVIRSPALQSGRINKVRLQSFREFDAQFDTRGAPSWGVTRLGVPGRAELTGRGVKIGVIDSGCDTSHPLLAHVKGGKDLNPGGTDQSWRLDEIGHGTHCAGVIGAASAQMRGMAPEAELYIYKVFPDGSFATLVDAMNAALADGVDILSMSLGSSVTSPYLAERFDAAKRAGVTCIVAAGNSGDDVKFPASLISAVAVSAMGFTGVIPEDSISAQTYAPALAAASGDFSPNFTCFGDAIDFVAPGVGVISTVPNNGLRAMDGTSMAAPHVSGMAALVLAHDPALQEAPRTSARVDRLVSRLRQLATPLPWGAARIGAGLPSIVAQPLLALHPGIFGLTAPWNGGYTQLH